MSVLLQIIESSTYAANTKSAYHLCVRRWLAFAGADPKGWEPMLVERWRDALAAANLSDKTVNKHLYALRYAARRYEALGHGLDFARAAETFRKPDSKRRRALTLEQVMAILATCDRSPRGIRDRAAIVVAVRTGMRASELVRLTWGVIEGVGTRRDRGRVGEISYRAKGGATRSIPADHETLAALEDWGGWLTASGRQLRGRVFRAIYPQGVDGSWRVTSSMSRQSLHNALADRGREVGISVHAHLFRHTFVTWALEAGVPPYRIMQITGHKSLDTLSKYAHDLQALTDPVAGHLPSLE